MSMTFSGSLSRDTAAYGGFVDAIGGVATIVLAIIGLAGVRPETLIAIATIVFGVALMIQGGAMLSEYARVMFPGEGTTPSIEQFGGNSISALFLVGAAGIVLGILALLGIQSAILTAVSIIAFGAALLLSSNFVWQLHVVKQASLPMESAGMGPAASIVANQMSSGSAGVQWLAGLSAIVLGILAVVGVYNNTLTLCALIALGSTLILTGSSLSATVVSFMRPGTAR